jgi:transcriptional regulator with XRE-family HTH domain
LPSYGARPGGIEDFKRSRTGTSATAAIARAFRRVREQAGLETEELALAVHRSERTIRYWETGQVEPCLTDLCLVAAACGRRPSELLAGLDLVRVDTLLQETRRKPKRRKAKCSDFDGKFRRGEGPVRNVQQNQGTPP